MDGSAFFELLLHGDKLPYPKRLLFTSELDQGRHVAHGNASNAFHPYLLHADMKCSLKQLKTKLMVNFDPLRCFVGDVEKEFSDRLKLWYDSLGGDAIGLTWEHSKVKWGKGFVRDVYLLKAPRRPGLGI